MIAWIVASAVGLLLICPLIFSAKKWAKFIIVSYLIGVIYYVAGVWQVYMEMQIVTDDLFRQHSSISVLLSMGCIMGPIWCLMNFNSGIVGYHWNLVTKTIADKGGKVVGGSLPIVIFTKGDKRYRAIAVVRRDQVILSNIIEEIQVNYLDIESI